MGVALMEPPTLHLIVGLPGAGKTTLARRLEGELPALRLTPDEWIGPLYGERLTQPELDAVRDPVENVQWGVAARALSLGASVVLDFGFWTRAERESFRERAATLGARSQVHGLVVAKDELWARLDRRNKDLPPHTFHITREQLDAWWALFEPPDDEELRLRSAPEESMQKKY
ncbi:MAG TPA: AAA family ATPase [Gemmatimonadaceae bacterium]|nr:AAA family ATPase [Gemmatimonadaceae bacterium]